MKAAATNHPMMKCGCAAQGTCSSKDGVDYDPPIPSCVVHSCIEVADEPDLGGRMARCAYNCGSQKPSSLGLPFFEFHGEGSPSALHTCKCGRQWIIHQPRWRAHIKVVRRWFKIECHESVIHKEFHAPENLKQQAAEIEAEFFRSQTIDPRTHVFSAEIVSIKEIPNPMKCRDFTARGAQEFDVYYCGCRGWD